MPDSTEGGTLHSADQEPVHRLPPACGQDLPNVRMIPEGLLCGKQHRHRRDELRQGVGHHLHKFPVRKSYEHRRECR